MRFLFRILMNLIILLPFFFATNMVLGSLVPEEVEALRSIGKTLGKKDSNFSVDPCSGLSGWTVNCSGGHITSINLREGGLQGTLPPELVRLPYLQELTLTRNYLSGTIPPEWGSMKLVTIILLANRLTGSIPAELANISTLQMLNIGFNQFSGNLPPELGKLPRLERLHLASNNFTGEIPATFAGLTELTHFRISDNQFFGKIPDFIANWKNLRILAIVGSGLSGPIPVGLSLLVNLVNLRISNLNGPDSNFPRLGNMKQLETMILRSCNIIGSLRLDFTENMPNLIVLDLSFNKLSGEMPSSFTRQSQVKSLYLSGNMLSGSVPDWLIKSENNVDLSYNNFSTNDNLKTSLCEQQNVNLFANPLEGNKSGLIPCSRSCPKTYYSFRINCGGKEIYVGGKRYEEDRTEGQASQLFVNERSNWAFSNTGHFLDDDQRASRSYIADNNNNSELVTANSELYTSARLSPISLTYYGFCLKNGNYTVSLHFAEIMFSADKSFRSLGRRVFDVYIQGKLMQKDFNIAVEAGGVGKTVIKNYTVVVNKNDLEIRLYWAGKGTTSIPDRGVYGPLISAISVDADFAIPLERGSHLPLGVVIAIVVVGAIIIVLGILWWIWFSKRKSTPHQELKVLDMQTGSFTLQQIMAATNNFDVTNKIGEGGFGPVYKGFLSDGTMIAVKQLSSKSRQGNREFLNEIGMISAMQNPHLVKLYGCCVQGSQLLLVYEYMENNSLAHALFGLENCRLNLDWSTRKNICIGIAKGLAFMHEESRLKIIHRDIKATNVLLDKDFNPKISDFGLAKLYDEDNTHISTRIAGTRGYIAPEYAMHGYLTKKADVYSFGIVALEVISGKTNMTQQSVEECFYLRDWAHQLKDGGNLMDLVDPRLGEDFNREEIMVVIDVALQCTENSPKLRPTMSKVLDILEGRSVAQEVVSDKGETVDDLKLESAKKEEADKDETSAINSSSHVSHATYISFSETN